MKSKLIKILSLIIFLSSALCVHAQAEYEYKRMSKSILWIQNAVMVDGIWDTAAYYLAGGGTRQTVSCILIALNQSTVLVPQFCSFEQFYMDAAPKSAEFKETSVSVTVYGYQGQPQTFMKKDVNHKFSVRKLRAEGSSLFLAEPEKLLRCNAFGQEGCIGFHVSDIMLLEEGEKAEVKSILSKQFTEYGFNFLKSPEGTPVAAAYKDYNGKFSFISLKEAAGMQYFFDGKFVNREFKEVFIDYDSKAGYKMVVKEPIQNQKAFKKAASQIKRVVQ